MGQGNGQQHRQGLVWPREVPLSWGFAQTASLPSSAQQLGAVVLTLGSFVFLNQSLPLPPAFTASSGTLTLSGCEFILYMDHLEPLTESNNNQQRTPGIAKLDLLGVLFFFFPQGSLNWPKPISDSQCATGQAKQTLSPPSLFA